MRGSTTWAYDTATMGGAGQLARGKLHRVSAPHAQYTRTHHYDALGDMLKGVVIAMVLQGVDFGKGMFSKLGKTINSFSKAIGVSRVVSFIGTSISKGLAFAGDFVSNTISNGIVQSIYTGLTAKILGGSFSGTFRDSIGVSVVSAAIREYRNPTPTQAELGRVEKITGRETTQNRFKKSLNIMADAARKAWNLPNTLVGLIYGGVGHVVGNIGYALGFTNIRPTISIGNNAVQFHNNPFGRLGAITLGNTITYGGSPNDIAADGNLFFEHETQHTYQGEQLGPFYLPSNIIGGITSLLVDGNWHGPSNWNEAGPQKHPPRKW